jgi:hypothetical protein
MKAFDRLVSGGMTPPVLSLTGMTNRDSATPAGFGRIPI